MGILGPIPSTRILDSGLTGRDLVQSANETAGRAAISLGTTDDVEFNSSTVDWVQLPEFTPSPTTNRLYNSGGKLYFNGSETGGNPFDQDLNTTDDVLFDKATLQNLTVKQGGFSKFYNFGTDGDTNTSFLEINSGSILWRRTGAASFGTFTVGFEGIAKPRVSMDGVANTISFKTNNVERISVMSDANVFFAANIKPSVTNLYNIGTVNQKFNAAHITFGNLGNINILEDGQFNFFKSGTTTDGEWFDFKYANLNGQWEMRPKRSGTGGFQDLSILASRFQNTYIRFRSGGSTLGIGFGDDSSFNNDSITFGSTQTLVGKTTVPTSGAITAGRTFGSATQRWPVIFATEFNGVTGQFSGTMTANAFVGDGSGLTNLPSANPFDQSLNTTDSPSFVDGDFSGTLTVDLIQGGESLLKLNESANQFLNIWNAAGSTQYYSFRNNSFLPKVSSIKLGLPVSTARWLEVHAVAGSYENLNVETGGSFKFYNLGDSHTNTTNTESMSLYSTSNVNYFYSAATGSGTVRDLRIGSASNNIWFRNSFGAYIFTAGGSAKLEITSSGVILQSDLFPWPDGTEVCGKTDHRWAEVNSLKFDAAATWNDAATTFDLITGDVTDTASDTESSLLNLKVGGTSYLRLRKNGDLLFGKQGGSARIVQNAGGIAILGDNGSTVQSFDQFFNYTYKTFRPISDNQHLGYVSRRFLLKANDIFSKGKIRSYNFGDETDVNAEYLNLHWLSDHGYLTVEGTGTGTARQFSIGTHTNGSIRFNHGTNIIRFSVGGVTASKMYLNSTGLTLYGVLSPQGHKTRDIGTDTTARWRVGYMDTCDLDDGRINQMTSSSSDPSTAEYANDGDWGVHKNTSTSKIYMSCNSSGTIYKVELVGGAPPP